MSGPSRLVRNVVWLALAQVVTLVVGFVIWVHLGRTLGAERLGMVAFGMALVSYFVLVVTLGFDAVAVREAARDGAREAEILPLLLGARLALAAGATAAFVGTTVALGLGPAYQATVLVLGVLVVARAVQLDWVYQAREEMGVSALRNAGAALVTVAVALATVRGPDDVVWAATALAAGPAVANLVLLVVYAREAGVPRPRFDLAGWKVLLAPAIPLAVSGFVMQLYYNVDKLMIEAFRTTAEVGLYEAGYKLYAVGIAAAGVLYSAFFPALSSAFGTVDAMRREGRRFGGALLALGPPVALAGAVFAPDLLTLLFGPEFVGAGPALSILFVYAALIYVSMTFGVPLMAWNDETAYLKAAIGGGIANVVLNVALIPRFGIVGAATATLASEAVVMVGMAVRYRRHTGTLHPELFGRAALAGVGGGLLPALAVSALGVPLLVALPVVALTSALAVWAAGLVAPKALLAAILRR
ncbi:flippase [Rubrivirga sp. IMCC43871]|uniref:flippase n=1 Tax=Rubrivirga sp. IMCC43871 TaxID=3391575 RepID=UPI00398F9BD3